MDEFVYTLPLLIIFFIYLVPGWWAYKDAQVRGKPPILTALMVVLLFPGGIFLWLVFRPPIIPPQADD